MPEYDFDGKVAFVTGAARGQGRSHAVGYAEHGADVIVTDVCEEIAMSPYPLATREDLDETARRIENAGGTALALKVDVRDESEVEAAVVEAIDEFGHIDILANNAGIWNVADSTQLSERQWTDTLATDLKGAWLCSKHVGKHFGQRDDGGKIVSTASIGGLVGVRGSAHYVAAKHGLVGLTKALAVELVEHDVNVNAVAPTGVNTPMIDGIVEAVGESALTSVSDVSGSMNVIDGQFLDPRDITEAYLWLSSDAARYVTGVTLPVDAGMRAK